MDIDNFEKNLEIIMQIIKRYLLFPFLIAVGAGSRVCYDYFKNKRMPTRNDIISMMILSIFSATVTYFIMVAFDYKLEHLTWLVLLMSFLGHTALTWFMENWTKIVKRVFKIKDEDEQTH